MKKIILTGVAFFLAIGLNASAQSYEVPKDYTLKEKSDYAKHEQDVINTVDWEQQTPWTEQGDKRKEANVFFMAWITGSPDVTITVGKPLLKLVDKNKELLFTFMGGYAKYAIQHKDNKDQNPANAAGVRLLIQKYQMEPSHARDKNIEKLIQLDKDGKLDAWVSTDYLKE